MFRFPNVILIIVCTALVLRIALLVVVLFSLGETALWVSDAPRFLKIAQALVAGHGFTLGDSPYAASAFFPPLFFLLLGGSLALTHSILPAIMVHMLLGAVVIPAVVWKISGYLTEDSRVRIAATLLAAFEPQMVLWSIVPTTEILAGSLLLLSFYFFVRLLETPEWRAASLSGFFLALSTLTRPHGQFLFIAAFMFLSIRVLYLFFKKRRFSFFPLLIFAFVFLATLSPWLARNYYHFHTVSVATTGLRNIYSDFAASVVTLHERGQFGEVRQRLYEDIAKKYKVSVQEIREDPQWGRAVAGEGLRIIATHPKETGEVLAIALGAFFTQDLYTFYLEHFRLIPPLSFDFSPSVVLMKEGPMVLARLIWQKLGLLAFIPVLSRFFWVVLTVSWVAGAVWAGKAGGRKRTVALLAISVIFYYALTSSIGAFSDQGRLRYPVNPFIFIFASFGFYQLILKYGNALRNLRVQ